MRARWALVTLVFACGGDPETEPPPEDAGPPPDAGTPTVAPPAPPLLTPCAAGWREVDGAEGVVCEPWPEGGPARCASDEAHFPGEPSCTRIGGACPTGAWADDVPEGRGPVVYVQAGAASNGAGTKASPFATLAEAVASGASVIALAKGSYDEEVELDAGTTLWGACVAETRIASSLEAESPGTVSAGGDGVELRNVSIGGERPGLWTPSGTSIHVEGVVIAGAHGVGWFIGDAASATARDVVVRDTGPLANGKFGDGVVVQGGRLEATRLAALDNRDFGLLAGDAGTELTLFQAVLSGTQPQQSDGKFGRGLGVQLGAVADVSATVLEHNHESAIFVGEASAKISDVVVRDTAPRQTDEKAGQGLHVDRAAVVELHRALFERNHESSIIVGSEGTVLTADDLILRDTQPRQVDPGYGTGITVGDAAQADIARVIITRGTGAGVFAIGPGTRLGLTDAVVSDHRSRTYDLAMGYGMDAEDGAHVDVTRARFERNRDTSVIAFAGTSMVLRDVVITDTLERECATGPCQGLGRGTGLTAFGGGQAQLESFLVTKSAFIGLQIVAGGSLDLRRGEVSHNLIGINVQAPDYDYQRLSDEVVLRDNQTDFDSETLPIPDPTQPL